MCTNEIHIMKVKINDSTKTPWVLLLLVFVTVTFLTAHISNSCFFSLLSFAFTEWTEEISYLPHNLLRAFKC